MEQVIIVEQPKQKPSVGVQVAALILGVVGFALSFGLYFGAIFRVIFNIVAQETGNGSYVSGGIAGVVFGCLICLICFIALILGIVGLVKSIKRATRTVKGIILSALGIDFAAAGFAFVFISGVLSTVLNAVLPQIFNAVR